MKPPGLAEPVNERVESDCVGADSRLWARHYVEHLHRLIQAAGFAKMIDEYAKGDHIGSDAHSLHLREQKVHPCKVSCRGKTGQEGVARRGLDGAASILNRVNEIPGRGGGAGAAEPVDELGEIEGVRREESHIGHLDEEAEGLVVQGQALLRPAGEHDRAGVGVGSAGGVRGEHAAKDGQGFGAVAADGGAEERTECVVTAAEGGLLGAEVLADATMAVGRGGSRCKTGMGWEGAESRQ